MSRRPSWAIGLALLASLVNIPPAARAQSVLDRPPNLAGGWAGTVGTLHFNFSHRFTAGGAPARKISNTPTLLAAGTLPGTILTGFNYATNSDLVTGMPNEWELFARVTPILQSRGAQLDLSAQMAYNVAAASADGELTAARRFRSVRILGIARGFTNGYGRSGSRAAVGAGTVIRLRPSLALAGDVVQLLHRGTDAERAAWSAGVQLGIPYTPHSLSLHATNVSTTTLQGSSRPTRRVMYGFEFTIPLTVRRYLPARTARVEPQPTDTISSDMPLEPVSADSAPVSPRDSARVLTDSSRAAMRDGTMVLPRDSAGVPARDSVRVPARDSAPPAVIIADSAASAQRPRAPTARAAVRTSPGARPATRVEIRQLVFAPQRIEVRAGTTVTWTNTDPLPHNVTAADRTWDSKEIAVGQSWSRTFTRPGRYEFFCAPHPFMKGVVVVLLPDQAVQR